MPADFGAQHEPSSAHGPPSPISVASRTTVFIRLSFRPIKALSATLGRP